MEYLSIVDQAAKMKDETPAKRLAYIGVFSIAQMTICEHSTTKPFNPMLGETYELITPEMRFLSEQVSHHPPITANYVESKRENVKIWSNTQTKSKFTGKALDFISVYKEYIEMEDFGETYEITLPTVSVHNLIIGTMYTDIGGGASVRLLGNQDLDCQLRYTKRGWLSKETFKVEGEVVEYLDKERKKSRSLYKIFGNWNSKVYIAKVNDQGGVDEGTKECVFTKNPQPERADFMYGMSHFALNMNNFPDYLKHKLPPTDTRRRPDQRELENGDYIQAAKEKERLE